MNSRIHKQTFQTYHNVPLLQSQELESLRATQTSLAADHERQRAAWESDLALALRQKDAERRPALVEVQETSGAEYRAFLAEHQDTLTRALTAAKEAHRQEKVGSGIDGWFIDMQFV